MLTHLDLKITKKTETVLNIMSSHATYHLYPNILE